MPLPRNPHLLHRQNLSGRFMQVGVYTTVGQQARTTCAQADQYSAVLACQRGNAGAIATIQAAGAPAVNAYMSGLQPSSYRRPGSRAILPPSTAPQAHAASRAPPSGAASVSVTVTNQSSDVHSYEIRDNACNTTQCLALAANGVTTIRLCSSGALSERIWFV